MAKSNGKGNGKATTYNPLETRPKSVAVIGLGPSHSEYFNARCSKKDYLSVDEVWTINSAINALKADKAFCMDDLRHIERIYPAWSTILRRSTTPIITCYAYDDWPNAYAYPIEEVCDNLKDDLFTNTVAYIIGYAIYIKVKELYMFGCDFMYPDMKSVESGLQSVGYMLGIARERGVHYYIPNTSTLLDAHLVNEQTGIKDKESGKLRRPLYGYHYNPGEAARAAMRGNADILEKKIVAKTQTQPTKPEKGANA